MCEVVGLQNLKTAIYSYNYCPQSSALCKLEPQKGSLHHLKNNLLLQKQIIGTRKTVSGIFQKKKPVSIPSNIQGETWPFLKK